jgi:hypothetical protein
LPRLACSTDKIVKQQARASARILCAAPGAPSSPPSLLSGFGAQIPPHTFLCAYRVNPTCACEGAERREALPYPSCRAAFAGHAGASRRSTGGSRRGAWRNRNSAPGPRFLGRGIGASPSPAGSLQSGRNAARSGPGAARERGHEPRARAPRPAATGCPVSAPKRSGACSPAPPLSIAPSSKRLATTPSAEQGEGSVGEDCGRIMILFLVP